VKIPRSIPMARYSETDFGGRRHSPRFNFRAGITLKACDPQVKMWDAGISQNLSQDGMSILHSKILTPGDDVYIDIPKFDEDNHLIIAGKVTWVGVDDLYGDSPYWVRAGIMFGELNQDQKESLLTVLSDRKIDGPIFVRRASKIDFVM
jgi:hypothetical protein